MANAIQAFGLRPVKRLDGSPWNGATKTCYKSAAYASGLYVGDPVLLSPTLAEKEATGMYPTINKSDGLSGSIVWGVVVGIGPNPDNLTQMYSPTLTEAYVKVAVGGDIVYEIAGDGGGALTAVIPGQNAVMIATSTGDTTSGLSGMNLDEGTTTAPNTTQAFTLHVLNVKSIANNALGINAVYEVLLNTDENATGKRLGITAA